MVDQVATAPCTDPIQNDFGLLRQSHEIIGVRYLCCSSVAFLIGYAAVFSNNRYQVG